MAIGCKSRIGNERAVLCSSSCLLPSLQLSQHSAQVRDPYYQPTMGMSTDTQEVLDHCSRSNSVQCKVQIPEDYQGPILHPAQLTFYADTCIVASLQPVQS